MFMFIFKNSPGYCVSLRKLAFTSKNKCVPNWSYANRNISKFYSSENNDSDVSNRILNVLKTFEKIDVSKVIHVRLILLF